jgi:hypothetical protein
VSDCADTVSPSSRGPGRRPFTPVTRVRIPPGTPHLHRSGGARQDAFCEGRDALHVEFLDEVDRFRVQERLVEPVELQADGFEPSFLFGGSVPGRGAGTLTQP